MLTILYKSVQGKLKNFRVHKWKSSNNQPNKSTKTFWEIRTPQRKHTFIEYLKLKALMGKSSEAELKVLYDAPGVLNDDLFLDALRAWKSGISEEILWQRLNFLQRLEGLTQWSPNLYYTYNNCFVYELREIRTPIRKVNKYSGYVRNSSAVGSKSQSNLHKPEPEIVEWINNEKEIDYYFFLTVGEFHSGSPGHFRFTLMRTKSSKR